MTTPDQLLLDRIHQIEEERKTKIDELMKHFRILKAIVRLASTAPHRQDLRMGANTCKDDCPACIAYKFLTGKLTERETKILNL